MFRLIESIPSKKAEPIKLQLARLGKERIDEEYDPEITINRALETYRRKGYSDDWINQRLKAIDARKEFTDELRNKGIEKSNDFASLTNLLTKVWSGFSVKEYKEYKGLTKENLRDNMTNMELVLNMLAEVSSTEISKSKNDTGYTSAESSVIKGSSIAKNAKEQIEQETGKKVVTSERHINTKQLRQQKTNIQGWQFVGNIHAKTHCHIKNDYAKTHNLAMLSAYRYLREKTLKYKGFITNGNYKK